MGWDERYCISSVKDKHIMHSMTQKKMLQHLGLFVTTKCQDSWKKKRSSLHLRQPEEASSRVVNAFGNKHQQGKVISLVVISFGARRHEAATCHHQHTCNMHQIGLLKATRQALAFGGAPHPMVRASLLTTMHLTAAGLPPFIIWMLNSPEQAYCCLHQKMKEVPHRQEHVALVRS